MYTSLSTSLLGISFSLNAVELVLITISGDIMMTDETIPLLSDHSADETSGGVTEEEDKERYGTNTSHQLSNGNKLFNVS